MLRPGLARFPSYADALTAVGDILAKEAAATASGLPAIDEEDDSEEEDEGRVSLLAFCVVGCAHVCVRV